jgi:hypothetical protein
VRKISTARAVYQVLLTASPDQPVGNPASLGEPRISIEMRAVHCKRFATRATVHGLRPGVAIFIGRAQITFETKETCQTWLKLRKRRTSDCVIAMSISCTDISTRETPEVLRVETKEDRFTMVSLLIRIYFSGFQQPWGRARVGHGADRHALFQDGRSETAAAFRMESLRLGSRGGAGKAIQTVKQWTRKINSLLFPSSNHPESTA